MTLKNAATIFLKKLVLKASFLAAVGCGAGQQQQKDSTSPVTIAAHPDCPTPGTFPVVFESREKRIILGNETMSIYSTGTGGGINNWYAMLGRMQELMGREENKAALRYWISPIMPHVEGKSIAAKAAAMDALVDLNIKYVRDNKTYGVDDHWATVLDTITRKEGDCEDYVLVKYFGLLELGVPADRLYVAVIEGNNADTAHAVLLVDIRANEDDPPKMIFLNNDGVENTPTVDTLKKEGYYLMNATGVWAVSPEKKAAWEQLSRPTVCIPLPKAPPPTKQWQHLAAAGGTFNR